MGQLRSGEAVFLSAGVPDPAARHYLGEGDSVAISAAVSAVLHVTLGRRRLVWGGHPAITPMVWAFAESMGIEYGSWVLLYQSLKFEDEFPDETARFRNVVFTERVGDDVGASLSLMRDRMIAENEFEAAVFVGGMQGVVDEYELFAEKAPKAVVLPIASTGGAARVLGERIGADAALAEDLDYVRLLYARLGIDPNEQRYASPSEQPVERGARIRRPGPQRG